MTIGAAIKKKHPDVYGPEGEGVSAGDVNVKLFENLGNPEKRAGVIKGIREEFPEMKAFSDDDVATAIHENTGFGLAPEDRAGAKKGAQMRKMASDYRGTMQKIGAAADGPDPFGKIAANQQRARNIPGPDEVQGGLEMKEVDRFSDLKAMDEANPGKYRIVNTAAPVFGGYKLPDLGSGLQLQDKDTGEAVMQLNPTASWKASDVPGAHLVPRLTGQASSLQQEAARLAGGIYNPRTGKWFNGVVPPLLRGKPGVDESQDFDGGIPEYMEETGAKFGKGGGGDLAYEAVTAGSTASALPMAAMGGLSKLRQKAAEGQEYLSKKLSGGKDEGPVDYGAEVSPYLSAAATSQTSSPQRSSAAARAAKAYGADADKYLGMAKDLSSPVPYNEETKELAGKTGGKISGEVLQMVAPTEVSLGLPVVGQAAGKALKYGAGRAAANAIEKAPGAEAVAKWFTNAPSAVGMKGPVKQIYENADAVRRNAKGIYERGLAESAGDDLAAVWAKHSLDNPGAQEAALKSAYAVWHSPEGRKKAPEVVQDAIRALQGSHHEVFKRMYPDAEYNPLHVFTGKDISRSPGGPSALRQQKVAYDPSVPGLENPDAFGGRYAGELPLEIDQKVERFGPGEPYGFKHEPGPEPSMQEEMHLPGLLGMTPKPLLARAETAEQIDMPGFPKTWKPKIERLEGKQVEADLPGNLPGERLSPKASLSAKDSIAEDLRAMREGGASPRDIGIAEKELGQSDALSALVRSGGNAAEKSGLGKSAFLGELKAKNAEIRSAYPNSWGKIDLDSPVASSSGVTPEGAARAMLPDLKRHDNVLVVIGDKVKGDHAHNRVVHVTQDVADALGVTTGSIAPRQVVKGAVEMASPNEAMLQASKIAKGLDKFLGLSQINYAITQGRPGFEATNRINEGARVLGYHGPQALDRSVLRDVAKLSNARPDSLEKIGNRSAWEVRQMAERYLGLGRGTSQELGALKREAASPSALSAVSPAMGKSLEASQKALNAPGTAVNHAVNQGVRRMFGNLNKVHDAGDAMKMWSFLAGMKEGMDPAAAARATRNLLMDYGDLNAAQTLTKPLFPFNKYTSAMPAGVAAIVSRNPRGFSRVNDLMNIMHNWDKSMEGQGETGVNFKALTPQDWASGSMVSRSGRDVLGDRTFTKTTIPTANEEVGSMLGGNVSALSPVIGSAMEFLTGERNKGGNILGLPKDAIPNITAATMLPGSTLPTQAMGAYNLQQAGAPLGSVTGTSPRAQTAYRVAQKMPLVSRIVDHPIVDLLGSKAMGLTPAEEMASDESRDMTTDDMLARMFGLRRQRFGAGQVGKRWADENKEQAGSLEKLLGQAMGKGR